MKGLGSHRAFSSIKARIIDRQEVDMAKPDDDEKKKPPKNPKDELHRPEETLGDAPAGGPNPTERSQVAD